MAGAIKRRQADSSSSAGKPSDSAPFSSQSTFDLESAGYDGNRDPGSPSGAGSTRPSAPGTPGGDRDPGSQRSNVKNKNIDLGTAAWSVVHGYEAPSGLPPRTKLSTMGQEVKIGLNSFQVEQFPQAPVFQYDVLVGSGTEKRGLVRAMWESKAVVQALGTGIIFDGSRLAWSLKPIDRELRLTVDLDLEKGKTPRPGGKKNEHRIIVRQTNKVRFDMLRAFLDGKADFDNACLEAINFLDHLLRETPSKKFTQIKRNFFARGEQRFALGGGVEAFKGVYQSLRMVLGPKGPCLSINLDVANGTFFTATSLPLMVVAITGRRDVNDVINSIRQGGKARLNTDLKRLRKVRVIAAHRGGTMDEYVIDRFEFQTAKEFKFQALDSTTGKEVSTSIYDYFQKKYNIRLVHPDLPLVRMTKGKMTVLPMEVLKVKENQRYPFKMDDKQTANMIKFAVTAPPERWGAIQHGLKMLDWSNDPELKRFGLQISPNRTNVNARLLTAPKVQFGTGQANPGTSGRWDLKGKKFLTPNTVPLKAWSVTVISGKRGGKPDKSAIENFTRQFITTYVGHGGKVENKNPALNLAAGTDIGAWVTSGWNAAGQQSNARPQILVFILPDKDSLVYGRIKRSAECRYGVVSQCMQYAHIQKAQPQYMSNVCMKLNAKLGGITCRAVGPKSSGVTGLFTQPTVIIGADVSHASPGAQVASMAAMTMSTDKLATRYAAACDTNGFRVEIIQTENINSLLKPMFQNWMTNVGSGKMPSRVIYLRDGVSEGQYQHVLEQEVKDIKGLLKSANPNANVPVTCIVGSKRHHVRFFPDRGDRNGNPLPGTLVETGVTHPYENDFYLCGHAAIKGTARPTHYHVILNECKMSNDEIHTLLYEHSYQYIRATTPVSIHPAIYYAHIASNRAGPHDPTWQGSSDGAPTQPPAGAPAGTQSGGSSSGVPQDFQKLMPMPNQGGIMSSMWYI